MINEFKNKFAFLSTAYNSPISDGRTIMPTVEHYVQALKADKMSDYLRISSAVTAEDARQIGETITPRYDWEKVRIDIMTEALRQKFTNPELRAALLATGTEYLENGNTSCDNCWGVCYCSKCNGKKGYNYLGRLLMKLRAHINLKGE